MSNPPALTQSQITNELLDANDYWAPGTQLTFSIPGAGASWSGYAGNDEPATFQALNATQAAAFRAAIAEWDSFIANDVVETSDATPGIIRVGFTTFSDIQDSWGYAYMPPDHGGAVDPVNGDIWINTNEAGSSDFAQGGYDWQALLHEIGHTLGEKHAFDSPALPAQYQTNRYTVMGSGYDEFTDDIWVKMTVSNGGNHASADFPYVEATTPMVLDIAAMQGRYGADPNTGSGNTVYHFSESSPFMYSIYDAGGTDTFDLSNLTRGSEVNLNPGAYSSIGHWSEDDQIAYWKTQVQPGLYSFIDDVFHNDAGDANVFTWTDDVGIAFSTTIENANGGSGSDTIIGNTVANTINGNNGDDTINGNNGDDHLFGGDGADSLLGNQDNDSLYGGNGADYLHGGADNDLVESDNGNDFSQGGKGVDVVYGNDGDDSVLGNLGNDQVYGGIGNDYVQGGNQDDVVHGDDGSDTVQGGRGNDQVYGDNGSDDVFGNLGNDSLFGGAGNDTLDGGTGVDTMSGGTNADHFVFTAITDSAVGTPDWITDFNPAEDVIDVSAIDANTGTPQDDAFFWVSSFDHQNGEAELTYDSTNDITHLLLDLNGDATADFELEINGHLTSGGSDWVM